MKSLMKSEKLDKTENDLIFIEKDEVLSEEEVEKHIAMLKNAAESWDASGAPDIKEVLMKIVPTFRLPGQVNSEAEYSEEMKIAK